MCDGKAPNSSSTRVRTEISEWLVDVKDMMLKEAKRRQAAEVVDMPAAAGVERPESDRHVDRPVHQVFGFGDAVLFQIDADGQHLCPPGVEENVNVGFAGTIEPSSGITQDPAEAMCCLRCCILFAVHAAAHKLKWCLNHLLPYFSISLMT